MKGSTNQSHFLLLSLALMVAPSACYTRGTSTNAGGGANILTMEAIAPYDHMTAYEVIERLRPEWLSARQAGAFLGGNARIGEDLVQVYLDSVRLSGVDELRSLEGRHVAEIRYLGSSDATMRFGTGHSAGAIMVTSRTGD